MTVKPRLPRLPVPATVAIASLVAALAAGSALAQLGGAPFVKRHKLPPPPAPAGAPAPAPVPLAGLDAAGLAAFAAGREEFVAVETVEGGLGPIFNDASCGACHKAGGVGGASERTVTRFGRMVNGRFDPMEAQGGSLLQARAIDPAAREHVPAAATIVAQRVTTPLFGAGLIEAIPDDAILMNAQRPKPDGVKGRAAMVTDPASGKVRVGRFGWKAQQATLLGFSGDAYVNEMGVTNRLFPKENAPNGRADLLARFDKVPDIEDTIDPATGKSDIDRAADFMRLLAPLPTLRATAASLAGARVFEQAGCAACHQPTMTTGPHAVPALSNQTVALYSDLLLHDMGALGDGIEQGAAGPREMRTAPLWGLRTRTSFLHDGRARTPAQAIQAHDGEAAASRRRFGALKPAEQQQLLEFLRTL